MDNLDLVQLYYIQTKKDTFDLTLDMVKGGALPILWFNQGLYGIVPIELIHDAIRVLNDVKQSQPYNYHVWPICWEMVKPIPTELGEFLRGLTTNNNNQTKNSSTGTS